MKRNTLIKYLILFAFIIAIIPISNIIVKAQTEATYEENYLRCIKEYEISNTFIKKDNNKLNISIIQAEWNITRWLYIIEIIDITTGKNISLPIKISNTKQIINLPISLINNHIYYIQLIRKVPWADSHIIPKPIPNEYIYISIYNESVYDIQTVLDEMFINSKFEFIEPPNNYLTLITYYQRGGVEPNGASYKAIKCAGNL